MSNQNTEELLKKTEVNKPWNKDCLERSLSYYRKVSETMIDAFDETSDPRFLNTALKLNDMLRGKNVDDIEWLTQRETEALQRLRKKEV